MVEVLASGWAAAKASVMGLVWELGLAMDSATGLEQEWGRYWSSADRLNLSKWELVRL